MERTVTFHFLRNLSNLPDLSVTSSAPSVVSVAYSNAVWQLTSVSLGTAIVTVTYQGVSTNETVTVLSPAISSSGIGLLLNGEPFRFTGLNAYSAGTYWGVNPGCGIMFTDQQLDSFFGSLRPHSLVRIWVRQGSMAWNGNTHTQDFTSLDRVFNAAARHGQMILASIADGGGGCDDGVVKDVNWYNGGFTNVYNSNGTTPLSFWNYVQLVVNHYKNHPALGIWEPINEPQGWLNGTNHTCDEAAGAAALRYFFDTVGAKIHQLDTNHLVCSGFQGTGQCGCTGGNYLHIHQSPGIDIASVHDYTYDGLYSDPYNGLQLRLTQMAQIGKPLIIGESGAIASDTQACQMTRLQRSEFLRSKMDAQFPAGVAGFIVWDFVPGTASGCAYETIDATDPIIPLLYGYAPGPYACDFNNGQLPAGSYLAGDNPGAGVTNAGGFANSGCLVLTRPAFSGSTTYGQWMITNDLANGAGVSSFAISFKL